MTGTGLRLLPWRVALAVVTTAVSLTVCASAAADGFTTTASRWSQPTATYSSFGQSGSYAATQIVCQPPAAGDPSAGFCVVAEGNHVIGYWSETANGHNAGDMIWDWAGAGQVGGLSQIVTVGGLGERAVFVTGGDGFLYELEVPDPNGGGLGPTPTQLQRVDTRRTGCPGDTLLAPPTVQLRSSSNSAFRQAFATDLVFVTTRTGGLPSSCIDQTGGRVLAFAADSFTDGQGNPAPVWAYNGNFARLQPELDSGCTVDYSRNQLYCGSPDSDASGPHVVALDTLTGRTLWLGALGQGGIGSCPNDAVARPLLGPGDQRLYVAGNDINCQGQVWALDPSGDGAGREKTLWQLSPTGQALASSLPDNLAIASPRNGVSWIFGVDGNSNLFAVTDDGQTGTVRQADNPSGPGSASFQTASVFLAAEDLLYVADVSGDVVECRVTSTPSVLCSDNRFGAYATLLPFGSQSVSYSLAADRSAPGAPFDRLMVGAYGWLARYPIPLAPGCNPHFGNPFPYHADLAVTLAGTGQGSYHAVVTNNGPDMASDARLLATPPGRAKVTLTPTQGGLVDGVADLGAIAAGASATVDVTTAASQLTVSVQSGECDPTSGDDTATATNPGPLDHLVLSPATASIAAGGSQTYTAEGFDAQGNDLGDLTNYATFAITPNGAGTGAACTGNACTATRAGSYTVTASDGTATGTAALTVTPGSLAGLILTPGSGSVTYGGSQGYQAEGFDAYGNDLGDKTTQSTFAIGADGSCAGASCTPGSVGAHTITASDGLAGGTASLSVNPAALSVRANDQSITYGDPIPPLTYQITGFVNGETPASSGLTGTPSCSTPATAGSSAGSYAITCTAGSLAAPNYSFPASNFTAATLTIAKRPATLAYTGQQFFSTGSATATTAPVAFQGTLTPAAGGSPNPSTAQPVFALYKSTNVAMVTPDQTCAATVTATGAVSCTVPTLGIDDWTVILLLPAADGYFTAPAADPVVVTVYQPSTGASASGAGWIIDPGFQNKPVAISPQHNHGNFGFDVRYKSGTTTPQGHAAYTFRGADGYEYVIRSTSWQGGGASITATTASFSGKAAVTVINPATRQPVAGLGGNNYSYRIDATQTSSGGTFAISVNDPTGALYHQAGSTHNQIALGRGKIVIHQ